MLTKGRNDAAQADRTFRVIVADDDPVTRRVVQQALNQHDVEVQPVKTCAELHQSVAADIDAVLLDLWMPDQNGIECLRQLRANGFDRPVVMITGEQKAQHAVEAMQAGAYHYLLKPLDTEEVYLVTRQAIRAYRERTENAGLREALGSSALEREWIGSSAVSRKVLATAHRIAQSDATVLITGETGTGKSLMARMLHGMSHRAAQPFVTISCAALPRELIDSELFGHEKGAYTGALRERPGKLEIAGAGSLFLDEIADLPLSVQPKVLRALQEREFERVGGNTTHRVAARLITATNQHLEDLCRRAEFREDLYYRVSVLRLHLPPLRERIDELPELVSHFLKKSRHPSGEPVSLDKKAMATLAQYAWPGNVRELQSVLERAVTFAPQPLLGVADLQLAPPLTAAPTASLAGRALAEIEAQAIRQTLDACAGNVAAAARVLGVAAKTLHRKIRTVCPRDGQSDHSAPVQKNAVDYS